MSDARLSDYVNLKDALRSFSQESRAIMLDDEDVARLFGRALAQIESLQRTNEELRASRDKLEGAYLSANERLADAKKQAEGQCDGCGEQLDDAFCTKCYVAAAITPKMRKRIEQRIEVFEMSPEQFPVDLALYRDLLKETVEPTLEGEQ